VDVLVHPVTDAVGLGWLGYDPYRIRQVGVPTSAGSRYKNSSSWTAGGDVVGGRGSWELSNLDSELLSWVTCVTLQRLSH